MKDFLKNITNEKSDAWIRILKYTTIVICAICLFIAICCLIGALFNPWDAGVFILLSICIALVSIGTFVMDMVVVNALYNLQEIRKVVTKEERDL